MSPPVLVVMALELEAQGLFEGRGDLFLVTGAGKVNATYRLLQRLTLLRDRGVRPLVLNLGTAGSRRHPRGTLLACRRFVQRDMDVSGLGFPLGSTPFEDAIPSELEFPAVLNELEEGVCATGDRFEAHLEELPWDVVDMEGYALAKVCWLENLPFACVKYVTDGADPGAAGDWESALPQAAREFRRICAAVEAARGAH